MPRYAALHTRSPLLQFWLNRAGQDVAEVERGRVSQGSRMPAALAQLVCEIGLDARQAHPGTALCSCTHSQPRFASWLGRAGQDVAKLAGESTLEHGRVAQGSRMPAALAQLVCEIGLDARQAGAPDVLESVLEV